VVSRKKWPGVVLAAIRVLAFVRRNAAYRASVAQLRKMIK